MRQTLHTSLCARRNAWRNTAVARQRGNHSNNKLSRHLVGTLMTSHRQLELISEYQERPICFMKTITITPDELYFLQKNLCMVTCHTSQVLSKPYINTLLSSFTTYYNLFTLTTQLPKYENMFDTIALFYITTFTLWTWRVIFHALLLPLTLPLGLPQSFNNFTITEINRAMY